MLTYAAPLTPDGATNTTLDKARNGVPIVNIASPNATGLSHNRFTHYNVNKSGLILNNARSTAVQTQLGGYITGNPHLTNNARLILNEVTSTNRTALNGFTEVAGPRTDLVIANPNGLTINGGGFINTGRLTLTTGKPVIAGGALQLLNVTGGDIAIQGAGLNTQGATSTELYTQYLNLNAKVHAQNLNVKLGGNNVNYATGAATANGTANARTVLLDASALGGMYANMITLVGTDKGLGVNLPPEVLASSGNITITNDGTISLQKVSATNNINITSANGVNLTKNLYSGASATIAADTNMNVSAGVIAAKNVMTINASQLTNAGTIIAGLNADQTQNTTGLMNITAPTIINTGDIQSTGNLIATGTTFTNNGIFNAGNDLTLSSGNLTNNKTLFAGNNMNLYTTGTLSNTANSNIFAMNNLTMSANAAGEKTALIINNQADIQTLNGNINVDALSFQNLATTPVIGTTYSLVGNVQTWTDFLQTRYKEAQLLSGGNMNLNADSILNRYSLISANGNINVTSNVLTNEFVNLNQKKITPTLQSYIYYVSCGFLGLKSCAVAGYRTVNVTSNTTVGTVTSTIQAGGNITGNVTNLTSTGINANQVINATPTTFQQSLSANNTLAINLPVGTQGLFVVSPNPQSKFLIVTNPAFASFGNFIGSSYLLDRIGYTPRLNVKLLGDALYESRLIRVSIFAQTGRRFLKVDITSDYAQFKYLMDNALAQREDLQLIPGVALTSAQVAALNSDIVWLVEKEIEGHKVLAPVVYIADTHDYLVEGGKIVAGDDINLLVDRLNNSGLMEAGNNLNVDAGDTITNQDGSIRANNNLSLLAKNDIENISADMAAKNITLVATNGDIINKRQFRYVTHRDANGYDSQTMVGSAGSIQAKNNLTLHAGESIVITGSKLKAKDVSLAAKDVDIATTVKRFDAFAGSNGSYIKTQSTTHLNSDISGENVAINTTGKTTVRGSNIHADNTLSIQAKALDIVAVNNSSYRESKIVKKGFLSSSSSTTRHATSTNIGSQLSGGNVSLSSSKDDVTVVGSEVAAKGKLALDSAKNIDVQAGFNGSMDETHTKKSGWFSGGHLFSKSEDLEGKLNKTAALAKLSGKDVSLNAGKDMALQGVNVTATESLDGKAQNITVANVNNVEKTYSKHEKMTVGFGDALKSIVQPYKAVKYKNGKASVTLAKAEINKAEKVTTKTTVVGSNLTADNIKLTAGSEGEGEGHDSRHSDGRSEGDRNEGGDDHPDGQGNINITGSNLTARNEVNLTAGNDVSIIEAKNTKKTASKDMKGKAELKLTAKNEYVQIAYAVQAAQQSKDNLLKSKNDYDQYKRDLGKQRGKLIKLKANLANGKIGIEQADVDELASLIDDLKADDAFYKANIALAAADLASKTIAVASQMATAAESSGTYGFSASLELDIDVLEKKFEAYKEQSVASNINANNINIAAGKTATVRGSNLNASKQLDITAKDTNILASQDVNTSSNSSEHKNINLSLGIYGGAGDNASVSADSAKGSSRGITNANSQLVASNININTNQTTTITGANVSASDSLNIKSKNLDVTSVQDSRNSRSNSQGFSISGSMDGISGVGANMGMNHFREKRTVLTTLNGNSVHINTAENTTLQGASIAAVDSQGNDNGNLKLEANTLEVSSLNNTRNSKSLSAGINVGISNQQQRDSSDNKSTLNSVGIDFSNDRANSKTKTLGTLGKGTIDVANVDKSSTKLLNRDVNNNTVDIYNIKSHKGLKGSLDTRVLTKKGRAEIRKEFRDFGKNMQTVAMGLPNSKDKQKVIAVVGEILDTLSKYTGGIVPSHGTNGGVLGNVPILGGNPDINFDASTVPGAYNGKKIYINGILNDKQDAQQGAKNIIGKGVDATWWNPTHGAIADLLESAMDILNGIGLQTGISKQLEHLQQINHKMKIYMFSQGNLITAEGARHSKGNGNTYFSYGSPMSDSSMKKAFSDKGNAPYILKDKRDPVSHPIPNIFIPKNWGSHSTKNYKRLIEERKQQ